MAISVPFNPAKSFAFVRVVKTVASAHTVIRPREGSGVTGKAARAANISPEDIGNSTRKRIDQTGAKTTPHDRLIDLFI